MNPTKIWVIRVFLAFEQDLSQEAGLPEKGKPAFFIYCHGNYCK
jgi:hypothetical protein